MLISKKYKFIFVHIYKNAGTSITNALMPYTLSPWQKKVHRKLKEKHIPSPFTDPHLFPTHTKASEMIDSLGRDRFDSYYTFAIVRNPLDWQVSLYKYMLKNKARHQHVFVQKLGSFEEYIKWRCENEVKNQKDFIYSENNELLVDFVGKFENLNEDFRKICSHIGVSASLPELNVSNTRPYLEYYTDETKNLVSQAFKQDMRTFDYSL